MKRNIIIILCFIFLVGWGCDLDVTPENSVTFENYFKTEKDIQTAVNTIKSNFRAYFSSSQIKYIKPGYVYDKLSFYYMMTVNWDVSCFTPEYSNFSWSGYYQIINLANVLLENIHKAKLNQERLNYYEGICHFYIGFTYFEIAKIWGEAPIQKDSYTTGIKGKASREEVLNYALEHLNLALQLPIRAELRTIDGSSDVDKSTPCRSTVEATRCELYLWYATTLNKPEYFQNAVKSANYVIDECGEYNLVDSPEEVCTKVLKGQSIEGIFESKFNYSEKTGRTLTAADLFVTYPINPVKGRGDIKSANGVVKQTTVNQLYPGHFVGNISDNVFKGDRRRLAYFYQMDTIAENPEWQTLSRGYAYPYKYRDIITSTDSWSLGAFDCFAMPSIYYRLADIILLRAEAYVLLNQPDLAVADLNRIRRRAYGDDSGDYQSSEGDLRYAVFKERERELLWEYKRYHDVIRNNYWQTELSTFHATQMTQADVDNGALFMPVGSDAFTSNPAMTQNKYWLSRY